MPGIVEFPQLVQRAVEGFGDLFYGEPRRRHFAEYLTGLFIADRRTVSGINREFAHSTDQSCLNRFLTETDWDVVELNQRRLDFFQQDPATCYSERGVIAIDNVLIDHAGKCIEDVGWFWDHAEDRSKIAHDYLFANYVCPGGKHYPPEFRRFRKQEQCAETGEVFENHTKLAKQLIDFTCERDIPGDFTWDSYFSNAEIMNHTHGKRDKYDRPGSGNFDWRDLGGTGKLDGVPFKGGLWMESSGGVRDGCRVEIPSRRKCWSPTVCGGKWCGF